MITLHDYNARVSGSNVPQQIKELMERVEMIERSTVDGVTPEAKTTIISLCNAISGTITGWVQEISVTVDDDPATTQNGASQTINGGAMQ